MQNHLENLAKRIKELRKEKGMTQQDLVVKSNFPLSVLSEIERGKRNPNLSTLIKLAEGLGVELKELFNF